MTTDPSHRLPTCFASAEILSGAQIAEQVEHLDYLGRLRSLLNLIPGLVALLNDERQVLVANTAWETLAHTLHRDSFVGMRLGEFLSCRWAVAAAYGCGTTEACRMCGATRAIRAQGGERTHKECRIASVGREGYDFRVTASPFEWHGKNYVLMVLSDISDEKRRQLLEKVFFHDVLNTAGSVSGIATLIADDPAMCEELKDDLLVSAEALVSEIKCQRMLLAAENNQLVAQAETVFARQVLEDVRHLYRSHPAAKGKRIEIDFGGVSFELKVDRTILQRVLANMVKNALEASKPGEIVWLGGESTADRCTFWCQNSGEIPREVALQIFQRSFTTKGVGRGIGTYSIKLLGERYLRGEVSFTTSADEGTHFQISLPRS